MTTGVDASRAFPLLRFDRIAWLTVGMVVGPALLATLERRRKGRRLGFAADFAEVGILGNGSRIREHAVRGVGVHAESQKNYLPVRIVIRSESF